MSRFSRRQTERGRHFEKQKEMFAKSRRDFKKNTLELAARIPNITSEELEAFKQKIEKY